MDKKTKKATYESPRLFDHGDVRKITLQGNLTNSDDPSGTPANTAYGPPAGS